MKKILIVTDKVLVEIGLLKDIEERLKAEGVSYVIYDGILPDPTYDQVEAGLEILKNNNTIIIGDFFKKIKHRK